MRRWWWLSWMIVAAAMPALAQERPAPKPPARPEPGLYMTFVTSMGNIHCRLFPHRAPIAVHTIVGLATGRLPYIDPRTHKRVAGRPFYDGIIFHRVIPKFMIQAGDPTGTGEHSAEGPGFPFKNEISPSLTFDRPRRLALANEGNSDSNGSQFFITVAPVPRLNGGFTIFGQCGDLNVVNAIANVPRGARNRPLHPVVIRRVIVRRIRGEEHPATRPAESRGAARNQPPARAR